jgi:alpha-D-xyloside xylohydrolase
VTRAWKQIMPGVWKATVGIPEKLTPVSMRTLPAAHGGFLSLPAVAAPPLPSAIGHVKHRGCVVRMPLAPEEALLQKFGGRVKMS